MSRAALLNAENIQIQHQGASVPVVSDFHLQVNAGEIVTILGSSGVGKSSLLHALAGLHPPSRGTITIDGRDIQQAKSAISLMFQQAILLPWQNVAQNVGFGLDFKSRETLSKAQINDQVEDALRAVNLTQHHQRYPDALSGGMAQRVALARSLARKPQLLLLDEPFSALDEVSRAQLQQLLIGLVSDQTIQAAILVTHDIDEALLVSDRIILLGGAPAHAVKSWHIASPTPRNLWLDQFSKIRQDILHTLHDVQNGSENQQSLERAHVH